MMFLNLSRTPRAAMLAVALLVANGTVFTPLAVAAGGRVTIQSKAAGSQPLSEQQIINTQNQAAQAACQKKYGAKSVATFVAASQQIFFGNTVAVSGVWQCS